MAVEVTKSWDKNGVEESTTFTLKSINGNEELKMFQAINQKAGRKLSMDELDEDPEAGSLFKMYLLKYAIKEPKKYRNEEKVGKLPTPVRNELFQEAAKLYAPSEAKKNKSTEE